eukprot:204817-Amphidinium_carterae.1
MGKSESGKLGCKDHAVELLGWVSIRYPLGFETPVTYLSYEPSPSLAGARSAGCYLPGTPPCWQKRATKLSYTAAKSAQLWLSGP